MDIYHMMVPFSVADPQDLFLVYLDWGTHDDHHVFFMENHGKSHEKPW